MPTLDPRPLTREERRALGRLAGGRDLVIALMVAVLVYQLALGLALGAIHLLAGPPGVAVWIAGAVLALPAALSVFLRLRCDLRQAQSAESRLHAEDLAAGRAEREVLEVRDALRVEELEGEGSSYFLALADGSVLFLNGPYLEEPEDEGRFPSTRLVVTRASRSRIVLDVECVGAPLPARGPRPPFDADDRRAGRVPADGALLDVDFESLRNG